MNLEEKQLKEHRLWSQVGDLMKCMAGIRTLKLWACWLTEELDLQEGWLKISGTSWSVRSFHCFILLGLLDYEKILNANRSYYLTRSQPPFLTDMTIQTYNGMTSKSSHTPESLHSWMCKGVKAAVKELFGVWLAKPRLDSSTGLSKYYPEGQGIPPETEGNSIIILYIHLFTTRIAF